MSEEPNELDSGGGYGDGVAPGRGALSRWLCYGEGHSEGMGLEDGSGRGSGLRPYIEGWESRDDDRVSGDGGVGCLAAREART